MLIGLNKLVKFFCGNQIPLMVTYKLTKSS